MSVSYCNKKKAHKCWPLYFSHSSRLMGEKQRGKNAPLLWACGTLMSVFNDKHVYANDLICFQCRPCWCSATTRLEYINIFIKNNLWLDASMLPGDWMYRSLFGSQFSWFCLWKWHIENVLITSPVAQYMDPLGFSFIISPTSRLLSKRWKWDQVGHHFRKLGLTPGQLLLMREHCEESWLRRKPPPGEQLKLHRHNAAHRKKRYSKSHPD